MRVQFNSKNGSVTISFSVEHSEMAKLVILDAVARYKEAGFDTSEIEQVLGLIYESHLTIQ